MKKIALSFLMFVGAVCAFDDTTAAADLLGHTYSEKDFVEIDYSAAVETAKTVKDKATDLVSKVVAEVKDRLKANDQEAVVVEMQPLVEHAPVAPVIIVAPQVAPTIESIVPVVVAEEVAVDAGSAVVVPTPEVPAIKAPESLTPDVSAVNTLEQSVALANVYVQFARDMFNPYAHAGAYSAMWKAGFKGALPILWDKHKPVIAGTAVITAAIVTATYYACKNGWFEKAKVWALDMQQASSAYIQGMFC